MQQQRQTYRKEAGKEPTTIRNLLQLKINSQQGHPQFFAKYGVSSWGASPRTGMSETLRRVGMLENLGTRLLDPSAPIPPKATSLPTKARRKSSRGHHLKPPALDLYNGKLSGQDLGNVRSDSCDSFVLNMQSPAEVLRPITKLRPAVSSLSEETEPELMRELLLHAYGHKIRQDVTFHAAEMAAAGVSTKNPSEAGDSWSIASAEGQSSSSFSSFSICSALNLHSNEDVRASNSRGRYDCAGASVGLGFESGEDEWESV